MRDALCLWMRHETQPNEQRAALAPEDARRLIERGVLLTVEESAQRLFPVHEYAAAGCEIVPQGSWVNHCPAEAYVLGLKELPDEPALLGHRHIFFGHAYKGQAGARPLRHRFGPQRAPGLRPGHRLGASGGAAASTPPAARRHRHRQRRITGPERVPDGCRETRPAKQGQNAAHSLSDTERAERTAVRTGGRGVVTQGCRAAGARARGACTRPVGCGRRRCGARSSRGQHPDSRRRCVLRLWPR